MKTITEYRNADLHRGKCRSCGDRTLITDDGRCPQCVEDAKFYQMTTCDGRK